jgi:hypothetical protein
MKKIVIILFLLTHSVFAQQPVKYFQVDKIKTIIGEIAEIKTEKSYHKSDFTIIYLKVKEKTGEEIYRIEVSPEWFFPMDLMKGSKIEVTGSYSSIDGQSLIMTQAITYRGEKYEFRDKYGFPLWRGKGQSMRQGKGFRGKGKRKRRGRH